MWFMSDLEDLAHMSLLVWFEDDMWWWVLANLINLADVDHASYPVWFPVTPLDTKWWALVGLSCQSPTGSSS